MARNTVSKLFLCFTLLLFGASFAFGQRDGVPTFSAIESHAVDSINLVTLVPSFNFEGVSKSVGTIPSTVYIETPGVCQTITNLGGHTYWTCGTSSYKNSMFWGVLNEMHGVTPVYSTTVVGNCSAFTVTALAGGSDGLTTFSLPSTVLHYPSTCGSTTATATTNDNTGYTAALTATSASNVSLSSITSRGGVVSNSTGITDTFGNTMTFSGGQTDTLGASVTITQSAGLYGPSTYAYTDTTGGAQSITLTQSSTNVYFNPLGSATCVNYPSTPFQVKPITSINYPDGTSYSFTWLTNNITGFNGIGGVIGTVTLRTGGTITYGYGTTNTNCNQTYGYTSLTRQDADGTTSYSTSVASGVRTTTVLDAGKNKKVYTFKGNPATFLTEVDTYQNTGTVGSPSYTQLTATTYCYNISGGTCQATPAYPITERDTDKYIGSSSGTHMSHRVEQYDSYGNTTSDAITDEITSQTLTTTTVYGTYSGGSCNSIGSNIHDHPCTVTTKNGTTQLSQTQYTYNTTTAPGALTAKTNWLSATSSLTTNYTPNTNGTYASIQAPNGQTTSYTYSTTGGCPTSGTGLLPTATSTTVNSIALTTGATWNCDGGVVTSTTDYNGNEDDTTYDSMFRVASYTDRLENATTFSYTPTSIQTTDPVGVVRYTYIDSLGRPSISQTKQSPSSSNYDTVSRAYQWNGTNFQTQTSVPCVTTLDNTCSTVAMTTLVNPAFGAISNTDANSGTLTYARNSNDASVTAGPAPSGEHTKVAQNEVDGFGRIKSTCLLESSGGTSCGQVMGNSGILTSASYSFGTGSSTTTTTRGVQTHTTVTDALGRTTSVTIPEAGTVTYFYDTIPSAGCWVNPASQAGFLTATKDNGGIYTCPGYDGLGRVQYVLSGNYCKRFYYDNSNGYYGQGAPSGFPSSGANLMGRLVEAETDNCVWNPKPVIITDEWFAYDKDGRMTDMWELSPNSGGAYRHTTVGYDADGTPTSLAGIPSVSTVTYGVDGEGRWNTATVGTTTIVSGMTYDAGSRPTQINIGTGTDKDTYSYDSLGNMTQYQFFVGSNNNKGILTWNPIGSLGSLAITDGFNSNNTQTCNFAYDDVARITTDNCGSVWSQTYDYGVNGGEYDNLSKSGSKSWSPGYNTSNNQYQNGATYDSNGNLKTDGSGNTYTWNVYNKMASENGTNVTYDAFGRMVAFGSWEYLYSPMGKLGVLSSSTPLLMEIPSPGIGHLDPRSSSSIYYYHHDWIGSSRVAHNVPTSSVAWSKSFSPYGDVYNTGTDVNDHFAGMDADTITGITYSTPNRELAFNASRWLSPDPAHASWNAYAYPTDPNRQTDPSGLGSCKYDACVVASYPNSEDHIDLEKNAADIWTTNYINVDPNRIYWTKSDQSRLKRVAPWIVGGTAAWAAAKQTMSNLDWIANKFAQQQTLWNLQQQADNLRAWLDQANAAEYANDVKNAGPANELEQMLFGTDEADTEKTIESAYASGAAAAAGAAWLPALPYMIIGGGIGAVSMTVGYDAVEAANGGTVFVKENTGPVIPITDVINQINQINH